MSFLDQPQARIPIGSFTVDGRPVSVDLDPYWYRMFNAIAKRVGGFSAMTNTELASVLDGALTGVFADRKEQIKLKPGNGITLTQDITGYTISADYGQILGAVRTFLPKQEPVRQVPAEDASRVLSNRVFRA